MFLMRKIQMLKAILVLVAPIVVTGVLLGVACSDDNPLGPLPEAIGWVEHKSPVEYHLLSIDFIDSRHGWISGVNGTILRTNDGGTKWKNQNSGTINTLRDIDFVNLTTGWAVGLFGTILYTNDSGRNWIAQVSGTTSNLIEVTFLDSLTGWIAGYNPTTILKTSDGGKNWAIDTITEFRIISSLNFADEKNGSVVLDLKHVVLSNDGGTSWTVLPDTNKLLIWGMSDINDSYGLIVSTTYEFFDGHTDAHDKIFETKDGGRNWSLIYRNRFGSMAGGKVFITDKNSIFVVGDLFIQHSSDGGLSWIRQFRHDSDFELWDAAFVSPKVGWVVGEKGLILRTTNGGVSLPTDSN